MAALMPLALLGAGFLIWDASNAAFTATTANPGNAWEAGSVTISTDAATAMFTASGLTPGDSGTRCITVRYTGDVAASVKLYATGYSGTLGPYLDLTVEQGSGGSSATCTGFTPSGTLYSGTVAGFAAGSTGFGNGLGTFTPSGPADSVYRFTYVLRDEDAAAGKSAVCGFTWEAQNT